MSLIEKGPSLVQEKSKVVFRFRNSHMSCLLFRTRKKETTNANKKSVNQKNFFLYSMSNKNLIFEAKKLWQEVCTRWLKFLYPVWFVSWCFNCSNLVSMLTRCRIISRVDFKNTRKKYSCFTCFRRNHSWLLLKNCKSPKQSQMEAPSVSSKKDHHWSKKKIQSCI